MELSFFDTVDYLEPKCPKCRVKIEYDINTKFDERKDCHICLKCGTLLK